MKSSSHQRSFTATLLLTLLSATTPRLAFAQNDKASAEVLLTQGLALEDQGKLTDACLKLEESLHLYSSLNTEYHLADCHERAGKLASAWSEFKDVAAKASAAGESAKGTKARERADRLAPKVPHLTLAIAVESTGMEVKRDGVVVEKGLWGVPLPIDPGTYAIEASAPGKITWRTKIEVHGDGANEHLEVPPLADDPMAQKWREGSSSASTFASVGNLEDGAVGDRGYVTSTPGATQRAFGVFVGALGVVGLGVGGALALSAKKTFDGASCVGDRCDAFGAEARENARNRSDVAKVVFVVSAVAIVGGGVLWLTAPSSSERKGGVKLATGVSLGGVLLAGSF